METSEYNKFSSDNIIHNSQRYCFTLQLQYSMQFHKTLLNKQFTNSKRHLFTNVCYMRNKYESTLVLMHSYAHK